MLCLPAVEAAMGGEMVRPHPTELRTRVVASVDEGIAARHFRVSPKFVNGLVRLRRETGSLAPRQGNGGGLVDVTSGITLDELAAEFSETYDSTVLRGLGLMHKRPASA
ncbi:hypothetical protein [Paenirhodobacter sp.]|uniref:hypothetical protein n=1 Tax=Paenirhodobacter sp. TaxID=1965326 RepID=UPI003B407487